MIITVLVHLHMAFGRYPFTAQLTKVLWILYHKINPDTGSLDYRLLLFIFNLNKLLGDSKYEKHTMQYF